MDSTIWGIIRIYFAKIGCNQWCVIFGVALTALSTKQAPSSKHLATVQCFAGKPLWIFNLTCSTHTNIAQFLLQWHSQSTTKYNQCHSGPQIFPNPHSTDQKKKHDMTMAEPPAEAIRGNLSTWEGSVKHKAGSQGATYSQHILPVFLYSFTFCPQLRVRHHI